MFQHLEALAGAAGQRQALRQKSSETALSQGLNLLKQAHVEGFTNPRRLQEATRLLLEALRQQRTDFRPCLGLAYIFLLLEDSVTAQKYISQATRLAPGEALIHLFQERSQDIARERRQRPVVAEAAPADDFDHRYDACLLRIRLLSRQLMTTGVPEPGPDAALIQTLNTRLDTLERELAHISTEISELDQEIETTDLLRGLKPLATVAAHLRRHLQQSESLQTLAGQMEADLEACHQICHEARLTAEPEDLPILDENLEALLDNFNGYEAELNRQYQQGAVSPLLSKLFEKLREAIETYQETLEEAQARLA
jgi:hypothetical protein